MEVSDQLHAPSHIYIYIYTYIHKHTQACLEIYCGPLTRELFYELTIRNSQPLLVLTDLAFSLFLRNWYDRFKVSSLKNRLGEVKLFKGVCRDTQVKSINATNLGYVISCVGNLAEEKSRIIMSEFLTSVVTLKVR
jgi:hypothetical protein